MPKVDDNTVELILEQLRQIRGELSDLKRGQTSMTQELRLVRHHDDVQVHENVFIRTEIDSLKEEIERLKARLDLRD